MDKRILQTYSTWAKENLENQIEVSLKALGINDEKNIKTAKIVGDFTIIDGDPTSYPADLLGKRNYIISLVNRMGYRNVIEEFAYTWFNRFVALRFMEVHDFLPHGFRVLSNPSGGVEPEILKNLNLVAGELKLDMNLCNEYKQQGKIEELYRYVLLKQCSALSGILPMLFSTDYSYLDLLLPKTLLKGDTVLTRLVAIPESAFLEDVEIIGWMYQFYISSKKDEVYASKKTITKYTLPAVTQLFTPDWIVRYMAQNSVGRLWLESYPDSPLRSKMKYYVEDAEQTPEVQKKLEEIRYKNVNPEDIRIIEPCCGSGHILVYVFDLLYEMYEERGYQKREIPTLILTKNLTGLDVDKRAVQLASFALVMKARSINNRFFDERYYIAPRVFELQDSKMLTDMNYRTYLKEIDVLNDNERQQIENLVDTFREGKTIGSLIRIGSIDFSDLDRALENIAKRSVSSIFNAEFLGNGMDRLKELSKLTKVLSEKYDVMITNPPYQAVSSMEEDFRNFAAVNYPKSKTDLFSMYMETSLVKHNGFQAMVTPQSWMFLSSYIDLREILISSKTLVTLANFGSHAFDGGFGTDAWCFRNTHINQFKGCYISLDAYNTQVEKENQLINKQNYYYQRMDLFALFPNNVFAFWCSDPMAKVFENQPQIKNNFQLESGIKTGKNNEFLRFWHEVSMRNTYYGLPDSNAIGNSKYAWFKCNKGGGYNKWYGAFEYVIKIGRNGYYIKEKVNASIYRLRDEQYYFKEGITWPHIGDVKFSCKYLPREIINDVAADAIYSNSETNLYEMLAYLNSCVFNSMMKMINPTVNYPLDSIGNAHYIPLPKTTSDRITELAMQNIDISKSDWDSFETSWDFQEHPLVSLSKELWDATAVGASMQYYYGEHPKVSGPVELCYMLWQGECRERFNKLKANEEELNRIFINIYGLQDELTPDVEDKDVTVRLADKERDIRSLISYLIGIVMGRYSLDVDGLAYAGGEWDASKYVTYQPDDDGIVPIYTKLGMEDGLTTKIIRLIKQIYGEDTYRQNIDFITEALGKNNNESSEEALNRYLNDGFYQDHLKIYQKRPIYWMFSSGKKAGFKCLIYMHRYNEDTLARINAKYYLPESTRKKNELDELNGRITKAEGREKTRLEKERQNLAAAYNEALEYGQVLDHMANQYIKIDLDDGVKVNYAKFQGVQLVTDNGTKVKKDLLVPLK